MAKKCIGLREDTGHPCKRPASGGSEFCYQHQLQEGDQRILAALNDVYHCPDDGQKLYWQPKNFREPGRSRHRCDTCGGVLLTEKGIDPVGLENILQLPKALDEGSVVECPTCIPDKSLTEGGVFLSNFVVEWYFSTQGHFPVVRRGLTNIGHCKECGSTWFSGPGEHDALGKKIPMYAKKEVWRNLNYRTTELFGEHAQSFLRDERVKRVIAKEEKEEKQKEKQCKHVDSNGQQCNSEKMQTKGAAYCYKHRPK